MRPMIARLVSRLALTGLTFFASDAWAQDRPACHQDHPNGARRRESLLKAGDAKMAHKAAGHTVIYAVHRYGLQEFFGDAEIAAAADEMYGFLKWKLGSPLLVATQWGTGGYQHFDKTYVDEAAAILLGVVDFEDVEPELKIPPFLQDWLQTQVGKTSDAVSVALVAEGVPPIIAEQLGRLAEQALQGLYDRNKVGVFLPKSYDVDNRLVETAVLAKRGVFRPEKLRETGAGLPAPGGYGTRGADGATAPGAPGSGRASDPVPHPSPVDAPELEALEARIAELEARVAELERRLSTTVGVGGPGGSEVTGRGYEGITLQYYSISGAAEIQVAVNDLLVGIYTENNTLDLTPYLVGGRMNKISYVATDGSGKITINGRLAGVDQNMKLYDVSLSQERSSDGITIPIL